MSEVMKVEAPTREVVPLRGSDLTLGPHAFQVFSVSLPGSITPEQLVSNDLWVHVLQKLNMGDEIRVIADDFSWRALLVVTFNNRKNIILRIADMAELDPVGEVDTPTNEYELRLKGPLKWCIVRVSDGENIKDGIPTQAEAQRALEDYLKALEL